MALRLTIGAFANALRDCGLSRARTPDLSGIPGKHRECQLKLLLLLNSTHRIQFTYIYDPISTLSGQDNLGQAWVFGRQAQSLIGPPAFQPLRRRATVPLGS
jgi:hypothetical protein